MDEKRIENRVLWLKRQVNGRTRKIKALKKECIKYNARLSDLRRLQAAKGGRPNRLLRGGENCKGPSCEEIKKVREAIQNLDAKLTQRIDLLSPKMSGFKEGQKALSDLNKKVAMLHEFIKEADIKKASLESEEQKAVTFRDLQRKFEACKGAIETKGLSSPSASVTIISEEQPFFVRGNRDFENVEELSVKTETKIADQEVAKKKSGVSLPFLRFFSDE